MSCASWSGGKEKEKKRRPDPESPIDGRGLDPDDEVLARRGLEGAVFVLLLSLWLLALDSVVVSWRDCTGTTLQMILHVLITQNREFCLFCDHEQPDAVKLRGVNWSRKLK